MTLTFPTMAEKAIADWRALTHTTPFERVAKAAGAFREAQGYTTEITWVFDDDTTVTCSGHGRAYKIEAHLP